MNNANIHNPNSLVGSSRLSPVFIYGHGKSGTTLLLSLLDGHPELLVFPIEPYFFGRLVRKTKDLTETEKAALIVDFLKSLHERLRRKGYVEAETEIYLQAFKNRLVNPLPLSSMRECVEAIVLSYGDIAGLLNDETQMWVEKTPEYEKYAQSAFGFWDDAKAIHMIRDPRDVFNSYRKVFGEHEKYNVNEQWFSMRWIKSVRLAYRNQELYGSDRYLIVRYEDIVRKPKLSMRAITEFLTIDESNALYQPTLGGNSWLGNSAHREKYKGINASSVGRWREDLDSHEVRQLEAYMSPEMQTCGYVTEMPISINLRIQGKVLRILDRWRTLLKRLLHTNIRELS